MRDIPKNVEAGRALVRKHNRLDLTGNELKAFTDGFNEKAKTSTNEAIWEAVVNAYYMGLAVGNRSAKRAR